MSDWGYYAFEKKHASGVPLCRFCLWRLVIHYVCNWYAVTAIGDRTDSNIPGIGGGWRHGAHGSELQILRRGRRVLKQQRGHYRFRWVRGAVTRTMGDELNLLALLQKVLDQFALQRCAVAAGKALRAACVKRAKGLGEINCLSKS